MTNEWKEFLAYTEQPDYSAAKKSDTHWMSRFTMKMNLDMLGYHRVLTIIARGYLFHEPDGSLKAGDPYERIEYARNALCAWCSVPVIEKSDPQTNFGALADMFPELVDASGLGWMCRHVQNMVRFMDEHPELISRADMSRREALRTGFQKAWRKKVRQLQVPIFAVNTEGHWTLRFDDLVAAALAEGPLRMEEYPLNDELIALIEERKPQKMPSHMAQEVVRYYLANRQPDTPWVPLPVINFDAFFGSGTFSKKWLKPLGETIIERDATAYGLSRYCLRDELLYACTDVQQN